MTATEPRLRAHDRQSLLAGAPDDSWRDKAACRDLHPGLFYPVGTTGPAVEQTHQAKQHCAGCPVRERCLEYALATNQDHGVWGGASEEDRRRIRRQRRQAAEASSS